MIVKSIHLENFKSHPNSLLEFDEVSSIHGGNGHGKTNIIRGLKLVLQHENWPTDWIQKGKKEAKITVVLGDDTVIERWRTHKSQGIKIIKDKEEIPFAGKKDAKSYIENVTGIKKITLDETTGPTDLNFIDVYDGPAVVGGRSDTVLRSITGLIGANTIEDARIRIGKRVKILTTRSETLSTEIGPLENSLNVLELNFKQLNEQFHNCKNLNQTWDDSKQRKTELFNKKNHIDTLTLSNITKEQCEKLHKSLVLVKLSYNVAMLGSTKLQKVKETISATQDYSQDLEVINASLSTAFSSLGDLSTIRKKLTFMRSTIQDFKSHDFFEQSYLHELKEIEEKRLELKAVKVEYKNDPLYCPTCGQLVGDV